MTSVDTFRPCGNEDVSVRRGRKLTLLPHPFGNSSYPVGNRQRATTVGPCHVFHDVFMDASSVPQSPHSPVILIVSCRVVALFYIAAFIFINAAM